MSTAVEQAPESRVIAVLLPCLNEEQTIGRVVSEFRAALPDAVVYVFDNASTDRTAERARDAGAEVVTSHRRGKGRVVRHMLQAVDADIYVIADGDSTYPADAAMQLIRALDATGADMVVGSRLGQHDAKAFRLFHKFGNKLISRLISTLFDARISDVLSGYRVLRRSLVRSLHLKSDGFDVETEMTLQTLVRNRYIVEVPIHYHERPKGSVSKLNSISDGLHILKLIVLIFRDFKPLVFFSILSVICFVAGIAAGWPPVFDYIETRYVSHVPLALLAAALEILAALFAGIGLVLNAIRSFHLQVMDGFDRVYRVVEDRNPRRS